MIDLCSKSPEECCGCGTCANVCPCGAISMKTEEKGFLYPSIDQAKCIGCGLCLKNCDFKNFAPTGKKPLCYAVRHIDDEEVSTSRSGGFFMAVCKYIIENEGVVFGCQLDDNFKAFHIYEETYEGCKKFKGSKYVQSDLRETFAECKRFLNDNRWVLFSGTGCQIHGLLSFLKTQHVLIERLVTVDIVCHGVPSPGVWNEYINLYQKRNNVEIKSVDFRNKDLNGWAEHIEKYVMATGTCVYTKQWTNMFYRHILFRESCYHCKYTTTERKSDFTIADYWGIADNAPEFDDNRGCSLVMIHTEKGKKTFKGVSKVLQYQETKLETSMQPQMSRPIWKGWDYKFFWSMYLSNSKKAIKIWFFPNKVTKLIWSLERKGKKILKTLLKYIK